MSQTIEQKEIDLIKVLFNEYKNAQDKSVAFNKIKKHVKDVERLDVWMSFFEPAKEVWRWLDLLDCKNKAQSSYKDIEQIIDKDSNEFHSLLNITIDFARVSIEDHETQKVDGDKKTIWIAVFKNVKDFEEKLNEKIEYWKNWRKQNFVFEKSKEVEIKEVLTIYVPMETIEITNRGEKELFSTKDIEPILKERISGVCKEFNDFHLENYMENNNLVSSELSSDGINWVFKFGVNELLNDVQKNEFKQDFLSQITDGWGESITQKTTIMGNKEIRLGFNVNQSMFVNNDSKNQNQKVKF